jgi:hypothetical protein
MSVDDVDNSNTTQPVSLPDDARQEQSPQTQTIRLVSPNQLTEHPQGCQLRNGPIKRAICSFGYRRRISSRHS